MCTEFPFALLYPGVCVLPDQPKAQAHDHQGMQGKAMAMVLSQSPGHMAPLSLPFSGSKAQAPSLCPQLLARMLYVGQL